MVESIVAINVALIGLLGVLNLLSTSLNLNREAGQKIIGTYLAAEGIEVVKNIIDKNYTDGSSWNNGVSAGDYEVVYNSSALDPVSDGYLRFDPVTGIYSYNGSEQTLFKRLIKIEERDNDGDNKTEEIIVKSTVKWNAHVGGTKEIFLEDHFFNWR